MKKEKLTEDEKRRLEFELYFDEMFAEAVSLYMTGQVGGDYRWFTYSRTHQGKILGRDREFMDNLEKSLHYVFFERLFHKGLRRVASELPLTYNVSREAFERYFRKAVAGTWHI